MEGGTDQAGCAVLNDFHCDVSIAKCKRAKHHVTAPRPAVATSSHGPLHQARNSIARTRGISYLLFGDNY